MPNNGYTFLNAQAQDQEIAGIYENIDSHLIYLLKSGQLNPKPLMICGGGTTSRCAAKGHWTLDLRKKYNHIKFNKLNNEVTIGAGVNMGNLISYISKFNRSFPIGISGKPGIGYILTGGISPLSRKYGLAVDHILEINGYWGNGNKLHLKSPDYTKNKQQKLEWKALCGAAPFLAIVTSIRLSTQSLNKLKVWETSIRSKELAETIELAESLPSSSSLYWVWGDNIKTYGVYELCHNSQEEEFEGIVNKLPRSEDFYKKRIESINDIPSLICPQEIFSSSKKQHSEVIGLLGNSLKGKSYELIGIIERIMKKRPNRYCFIACQQLGGAVKENSNYTSSFIYRDAIWKPWITGSWDAGNEKERIKTLLWMENSWITLKKFFPGIHMAQIHPHLPWHKQEMNLAFKSWLPELKELKSNYDPKGILPPI